MNSLILKRLKLISLIVLLISQSSFAQEKIKPDLKIIKLLAKTPYETESNAQVDNLLRILYFRPQPENNAKIGFLDTKGEIKIKPIYNMASDFYNGYANIIKDSVYGYIDKNGIEFLFKQYQETYFYYGNIGIAKKDGKFGLIDRKGNQLTDFKYNMIYFFGFNHFTGTLSKDSSQLLDNRGRIIFNKKIDHTIKSGYFEKDSLLIYEKIINNKKFQGLVGLDNEVVTDPIYDNIFFIEDKEFCLVKKNKKYGYINKKGIEVIPLIYDDVAFNITEDLIPVKQENKWGFINRKNETKIPFEYDEAHPFFDGLAFVKKENLYQVIDRSNKIKFSSQKSDFPFYSNNLSVSKKEGKYGYIDKTGKVTIPAIYDYAYPFVNKLAYVELNGKSGFINKKGQEIIPTVYKQLWFVSDDLIRFVK